MAASIFFEMSCREEDQGYDIALACLGGAERIGLPSSNIISLPNRYEIKQAEGVLFSRRRRLLRQYRCS